MRKVFLLTTIFLSVSTILQAQAQRSPSQSKSTSSPKLKKVMALKMPKTEDDDKPGTRGASVTWHPVQKKYYASFAGNMEYPMGVFDVTGKRLSDDELTTQIDTRGLWFNPANKLLCGNSYSEFGWFRYSLDKKGIPSEVEVVKDGMNQPGENSVGVYNTLTKQVLFLLHSQVYVYNSDAELTDSIAIHWGRKKADGVNEDEDLTEDPEDYNTTSLIYTGIKGQELGFLNTYNTEIEFYDIKTGFLTKSIGFPEGATVESTFNFAYANGIYWLFNMEDRTWIGYK